LVQVPFETLVFYNKRYKVLLIKFLCFVQVTLLNHEPSGKHRQMDQWKPKPIENCGWRIRLVFPNNVRLTKYKLLVDKSRLNFVFEKWRQLRHHLVIWQKRFVKFRFVILVQLEGEQVVRIIVLFAFVCLLYLNFNVFSFESPFLGKLVWKRPLSPDER
jgi:hypothetical protein